MADFHQLVLLPSTLLRVEGGEYFASGSCFYLDALDVRAENKQSVQYDSEEFRPRVGEKVGVVGNGCGLPIRLIGVCGEECHFAFTSIENHFLGGDPSGDGGDLTL